MKNTSPLKKESSNDPKNSGVYRFAAQTGSTGGDAENVPVDGCGGGGHCELKMGEPVNAPMALTLFVLGVLTIVAATALYPDRWR